MEYSKDLIAHVKLVKVASKWSDEISSENGLPMSEPKTKGAMPAIKQGGIHS